MIGVFCDYLLVARLEDEYRVTVDRTSFKRNFAFDPIHQQLSIVVRLQIFVCTGVFFFSVQDSTPSRRSEINWVEGTGFNNRTNVWQLCLFLQRLLALRSQASKGNFNTWRQNLRKLTLFIELLSSITKLDKEIQRLIF